MPALRQMTNTADIQLAGLLLRFERGDPIENIRILKTNLHSFKTRKCKVDEMRSATVSLCFTIIRHNYTVLEEVSNR